MILTMSMITTNQNKSIFSFFFSTFFLNYWYNFMKTSPYSKRSAVLISTMSALA
uniref:Uncharacterized protein n=1 Tax=Anguilla anguilla TaxID=7936 RepID=A0A0E9VZR8_ANGAN